MKFKIISTLFLIVLIIAGCSRNMESAQYDSDTEEDTNRSTDVEQMQEAVFTENSDSDVWREWAFTDIAIDGDDLRDTIRVRRYLNEDIQYHVEVLLGNGIKVTQTYYGFPLVLGNRLLRCDITNDGIPEFIFPEVGGDSTLGEVVPHIFYFEDGAIRDVPLPDIYFDGNEHIFQIEEQGDFLKFASNYSGRQYQISRNDILAENNNASLKYSASTQYVISCKVVVLDDKRLALNLKIVILPFFTSIEENHLIEQGKSMLFDSVLVYDAGSWTLFNEALNAED